MPGPLKRNKVRVAIIDAMGFALTVYTLSSAPQGRRAARPHRAFSRSDSGVCLGAHACGFAHGCVALGDTANLHDGAAAGLAEPPAEARCWGPRGREGRG